MRDLIDVYLKPFEVIVKGTDVKTIMSSYNSRDRVPNSASKFLMTELLRNRWGFKGLVYSDWAAVSMLKSFHHVAEDDEAAALACPHCRFGRGSVEQLLPDIGGGGARGTL